MEPTAMLEEKYMLLRACNLPNMKTLDLQFILEPFLAEEWFDYGNDVREIFALVQKFSAVCTEMFRKSNVSIGVYVKDRLFEPYLRKLGLNELDDINLTESLDFDLHRIPGNETVWKASIGQPGDPYAFEGMHLEFIRAGQFDAYVYDYLLEEALDGLYNDTDDGMDEDGDFRDSMFDEDGELI